MNRKNKFIIILILLLLSTVSLIGWYKWAIPKIWIKSSVWDVGTIKSSEIVKTTISIQNKGIKKLNIHIKSSCPCITIETYKNFFSYNTIQLRLIYNPTDDSGEIEKIVYIYSNDPVNPVILFHVKAKVINQHISRIKSNTARKIPFYKDENSNIIFLFYSGKCKYCFDLEKLIYKKTKNQNINLKVVKINLNEAKNLEILNQYEKQNHVFFKELPVLIFKNNYIAGKKNINSHLTDFMESVFIHKQEYKSNYSQPEIKKNILIIGLSGLIDGINPCAFATIIFLLGYLTIRKQNKIRLFIMGFIFAVFCTYFFIGIGVFYFLLKLLIFHAISTFFYYFTVVFAFGLGIFSLYDAYVCYKREEHKIFLQLPDFLKLKINYFIRNSTKQKKIILPSICLGIIVSLFELNCTGQIYLPTIMYIIKQKSFHYGIFLLLIYNFMAILPLITIGLIIQSQLIYKRWQIIVVNNLFIIKILTAFLFFTLGIAYILN